MIIAIDGPAASGKSTVSKALAERLGFGYLDTGAMYRAVALKALETGTPLGDDEAMTALAEGVTIGFEREGGPLPGRVLLDGMDVTAAIREPRVDEAVSPASRVPGVRRAMVDHQRLIAVTGDHVVEGRDIGSVVFPDAEVKVYLTASTTERARRRLDDLERAGHVKARDEVEEDLGRRDHIDSTRTASPLTVPDGAVSIDTTVMSVGEIVDAIAALAQGA